MNQAFVRFKELADKKKNVYDEDIEAIVAEEILRVPGRPDKFELVYLNVNSSSDGIPAATVKMRVDGGEIMDYASGDGVVDACYKVITKITGSESQLVRYSGQRHHRRHRCSRRSVLRARRRRHPRVGAGSAHGHHHGERTGLHQRAQQIGRKETLSAGGGERGTMNYKIAVLPGDGIGPEVMGEGTQVLQQVAQALWLRRGAGIRDCRRRVDRRAR